MAKSKTSSDKITLTVQPRSVFGKKLRKYRIEGMVPANIFGPEFKSVSVGIPFNDFVKTYRVVRETGIVYILLDKVEIPVMIKHLQKHPITDSVLHVDFRKIDLKKKIQTEVPVVTVKTSEAVSQKGGVLLTQSSTLLIEALPGDIPKEISVDISGIKEIGQEIKVADLPKSTVYEIKTPAEKVVVSVVAHKEESITPETTAAAPEVIGEAPAEGAEGAVPAADAGKKPEGAAPETPKKEEKK